MRRRIPALTLLGLFSILAASGGQTAFGFGGRGGQTYHYNGSAGYWAGGSYAGQANCYVYQTPQYAPQPTYYAPQPAYYAPQPAYGTPMNAVYAPAQSPWQAAPQR